MLNGRKTEEKLWFSSVFCESCHSGPNIYKRIIKCFPSLLSLCCVDLSYLKAHILDFYHWFRQTMYHFHERVQTVANLSLSDDSLKLFHHNVLQVLFETALPIAFSSCASNPK